MANKKTDQCYLAFVDFESTDSDGVKQTKITAIEPIDVDVLNDDKRLIASYYSSLQLIDAVQLNVGELLQSIVNCAIEFHKTSQMSDELLDEIMLDFSRQLLNVLGMFRAFLDHSDYSLIKEFGKDSSEFSSWKNSLALQYDSILEYRFFSKLRNYSQHIGMPPLHISFSQSAETDSTTFRLDISKDQLLADTFTWGSRVSADLASLPEKIPVIELLNNWRESYKKVAIKLLEIKRDAAKEAARRVTSHRKRLKLPTVSGKLCVTSIPTGKKKLKALNLKMAWLPEDKANAILKSKHIKQFKTKSPQP
jgi:hypothetical protein